ncbi:hypothetical protein OH77DRAFT_1423598 [Trametes cingulata]|nr:hypothetical protein OH77DRAFT_1423598 [Trametes cingulata]
MSLGAKRSASPLPLHLDHIRKIKLSTQKKDKNKDNAAPLLESSTGPNHGQEVISLSPFLPRVEAHRDVNDLIIRTVTRLAQEGKRLTRAPQLLPDGISFDWVSDVTVKGQSLRSLLSVKGIRPADLDRVLSRVSPRTTRASTLEPPRLQESLCSEGPSRSNASAPPSSHLPLGNASNPIVIDDGQEDEAEIMDTTLGVTGNAVMESIAKRRSSMNEMRPVSVLPLTASSLLSRDPASPKRVMAGPSGIGSYDSSTSPCSTAAQSRGRTESAAAPPSLANDRASVVTYASPPRAERPEQARHASDGDGRAAGTTLLRDRPSFDDDVLHADDSHSTRDPDPPYTRQRGKRRADYGNWKSLCAESSEAEMDDGHSSSRESSPDRAFPPQSFHHIPGLNFLPQTYDVSGLVAQQAFASGSRSGSHSSSAASLEGAGCSPPTRAQSASSRTGRNRSVRRLHGTTSDSDAAGGPFDARRNSVQRAREGSHDTTDASSDYMDVETPDDEVQQEMSGSRNSTGPGGRHRVQRGVTRQRLQGKGTIPSKHSQAISSALRTPLSSSADVASDSEEDQQGPMDQAGSAGRTVVIPKAEFARGRRLLTPRNQDIPLTTILMRGDAHFIDQRQKSRISSWSLPVEDDSRHVEDACLIGEGIAVVGYNKGPCQVSLIPVQGDQRPCRIDLSYRAHSTVIERRSTGTSYPNPGIACLAPVASDSFLSGGHDKTVRHWKVTRSEGQSANPAAFSAGSVRIPMEHSQAVQALAYSSWNNTVYSGSGDRIATTRLDAWAPSEPVRVSGKVTQVHVHPQDPRLIALEVGHSGRAIQFPAPPMSMTAPGSTTANRCAEQIDHMDYQVHFYDTREGGFGRKPWLEFGYRTAPPKPRSASRAAAGHSASSTPKTGSRWIRGSTMNSLFARGYGDGVVLVWDVRNGAQKKVLERFSVQRPTEVVHTVLAGSDVIAYGGYSVTFWSMLSE